MEKNVEKKVAEIVVTFTSSKDEWTKAQNKEFNKRKAKLKVPGFRVGNVPENIARRYINPHEVKEAAVIELANANYRAFLNEEKVNPLSQPILNITKMTDDELEVTVTIALPPVVTLGQYKGLKVEKKEVAVDDSEVDAEIEKLRNQQAIMEIKDGEANNGDTVVIDFKGYVNNIPFEGGEAKNYELKLGSNAFIPGFEDALVGIKANESRTIDVVFPTNYVESLAGKAAKFEVKCHDVKQTVLPELNEEFVDELNYQDVKTIDDLKVYVKNDLTKRKEQQNEQSRLNQIIDKCVENASMEISDIIINDEAMAQFDRLKKQVESNGLKVDDYLKVINQTEAQYMDALKASAKQGIKRMLVVDQICAQEKIIVDSKALNEKCEALAKQYSMKIEDVRKAIEPRQNDFLREIRDEMFTKFILENNND